MDKFVSEKHTVHNRLDIKELLFVIKFCQSSPFQINQISKFEPQSFSVIEGSPAYFNGRLQKGDQILAVSSLSF